MLDCGAEISTGYSAGLVSGSELGSILLDGSEPMIEATGRCIGVVLSDFCRRVNKIADT